MNVGLALLVAVFQGLLIWRLRHRPERWRWLRMGFLAIGLYWAGLYTFVLLKEPGSYNSVWFGQVFVRPAFTLTLAMMAGSAIWRGRTR